MNAGSKNESGTTKSGLRDRTSRQYPAAYGGYASPWAIGNPIEMVVIGLLVIIGLGVIGWPFIVLFFSALNGSTGLNFVPPTTTTTVTGRRKRDAQGQFPSLNPQLTDKLLYIMEQFAQSSDKISLLKNLFQDA